MPIDRRDDIAAFRAFIDEHLAQGSSVLTPVEALDLWELQNSSDPEHDETIAAIRQGLEDANAGRVRPFEEFDREFRLRHGLPPRP